MAGPPKQRVIYALKNEIQGGITLLISTLNSLKEDRISGTIIDQKGRNQKHVVFQAQQHATILKDQVIQKIEVKCIQDGRKYLISMSDYNTMIYDLMKQDMRDSKNPDNQGHDDNDNSEHSYSNSQNSQQQESQSDQNSDSSNNNNNNRRNTKNNNYNYEDHSNDQQIYSYENDDSNLDKRRGRPKGSKNKKTIIKEIIQSNQMMMELKMAISGKIKRGKGRPKGSKNKPKQIKFENRDAIKLEQGEGMPFGKRGKGRPKGSKNKIKALNLHIMNEQQHQIVQKRGRGRPKGAKNKANSVVSGTLQQQAEEQFVKIEYIQIDLKPYQNVQCCTKCIERLQKRKIVMGEVEIEEMQNTLKNVTEDFGPENKLNLVVLSIQLGDWQTLDILLNRINETEIYFRPPFEMQKVSQKTKYTVRTKKQNLSKTGKQGIFALLHDNYQRKEFWWKQIGIQRIIQSLPRDRDEGLEILQRLFNYSPKLRAEFFANLTSFFRKGNYALAEYLLKETLQYPNTNKLNFSQEHYSLLTGDFTVLNQLKKYYIIKQNQGNNYCSPIHCAAINPNPQFLRKLLSIFTDIINVEDNQQKKPIHYASVYENTANLVTLVENGADLREVDRKKLTPLMLACEQGITSNVEYILQVLRDPYYINLRSEEGYSALHYAVLNNSQDCVEALINDPHTELLIETREKQDVFHLLAGTGNMQILQMFLKKEIRPIHSSDRYKRTPAMIAIRNHNNDFFYRIIQQGCRIDKNDSSQNSLLHYAAAYGNIEAIAFLKAQSFEQKKNKKGIYPIQIAVLKGHIECAKILQDELQEMEFQEDILYLLLSNIQGSAEYFKCVEYAWEKFVRNPNFQDKVTGNNYLHMVCSLSEEQYIKRRRLYTTLKQDKLKREFQFITQKLITFLLGKGLDPLSQNKKKETPLKMSIENYNLIGVKILLPDKIDFQIESSNGYSILHCLSNIACKGNEEMTFVQKKLKNSSINQLRVNLKKVDINGFDFLLYFVKNFVKTAKSNFDKLLQQKLLDNKITKLEAEKASIEEFIKYEDKFIKFVTYLTEMGCDINNQVVSKRSNVPDTYKKWGIQHFLMGFPSLKLIKFFKSKIRDFNAMNNLNRTPLHLFCINCKKGNLFDAQNCAIDDYRTQCILDYLLLNGLNPNFEDNFKSLPVLYAAQNNQLQFMFMLRRYKSEINFCSIQNQVPFIEIIKKRNRFNFQQIEALLKLGCDPNFMDMDKRTSLHHLVYYSQSFDSSPQICKLLIEYNARVNALDKFERSPIFYCFTSIDQDDPNVIISNSCLQSSKQINNKRKSLQEQLMDDKVGILQVLMNVKDINLNLLDLYRRSLVHYACEKNYFYSILYLLDKNINIEVRDFQDNTPLGVCLRSKNLDQAALIIKKGVRYGYINQNGEKMSYFAYAIKNLSVGICFMLLDYGYPIQKALQQVPSQVFKKILINKYIK